MTKYYTLAAEKAQKEYNRDYIIENTSFHLHLIGQNFIKTTSYLS